MKKLWWIITVGGYGSFAFKGTEKEAEEMRAHKAEWEGGSGRKRKADPKNSKDAELVAVEKAWIRTSMTARKSSKT